MSPPPPPPPPPLRVPAGPGCGRAVGARGQAGTGAQAATRHSRRPASLLERPRGPVLPRRPRKRLARTASASDPRRRRTPLTAGAGPAVLIAGGRGGLCRALAPGAAESEPTVPAPPQPRRPSRAKAPLGRRRRTKLRGPRAPPGPAARPFNTSPGPSRAGRHGQDPFPRRQRTGDSPRPEPPGPAPTGASERESQGLGPVASGAARGRTTGRPRTRRGKRTHGGTRNERPMGRPFHLSFSLSSGPGVGWGPARRA